MRKMLRVSNLCAHFLNKKIVTSRVVLMMLTVALKPTCHIVGLMFFPLFFFFSSYIFSAFFFLLFFLSSLFSLVVFRVSLDL